MATPQQAHGLTSHYEKLYTKKYGRKPNINRHSARWGFDNILRGMSPAEAKALIDYYFTTVGYKSHDLEWFFYHYHELIDSKNEAEADLARIRQLMKQSKERSEEWRKTHGE